MGNFIIPFAVIIAVIVFLYFRSNGNNSENAQENIRIGVEFLENNRKSNNVQETSTGLQYQVLTKGEGAEHPGPKDRVKVHYHGTLIDGTVFDSSVDRDEPITFALNQVITGWTEGLQLMVVGEKTRLYIPSNLAYGNRSTGKIAGGSMLIFDVELLAINE
ncbi:MAG: FKBP-type peptidyl-prolyl cis-trans isomerase [Alteromonadaceae bacterium]|nr:FKBP-type peptidyl-prolyl cis-trans isomerase [Alteromonadaceae bacterium]